ncbi:hypothetical protein CHLRE_07g334851v5 [Chlamydomonas reinhardtii]|uniref:DNL-type domain-containing protein n=1 Tax=Chlamydomonas reinhardtii TaxID=3055 RepID=A0A2K3DK66_CHLRE|nr:uncharacterized protein CHLRE_07g334851v5 [Chlamydomonas reinhardtii]PNW80911.1 hypothetical protein CHLRE_07g334851v5 [Chlamydomonas reinhardtii]
MSCGAFAPGQRASACTIWRSCSSASLRLRAAQSSTASFPTFASSTCTIGSSCRRGFCSSGGSASSSNSADGEVTAGQERRLEPGATPLAAIQPRIMMVFTCTKCDTRSTKAFSKQSYQNGVVLVRCPGCQKLHLVADHLGWFGEEPFVLHEHVAQLGGNVVRIAADDPHTGNAAVSAPAAAAPTAASVASVPAFAPHPDGQQQVAAGSDPADPGLAARTAAAVAAAVSSDGGLFELSDESQVRAALAEARELKGQQRQRQQPRDESKGKQ